VLEDARSETADMVIALLNKRFGLIAEDKQSAVKSLPMSTLRDLNLAVLDFSFVEDLSQWLSENTVDTGSKA